MFIMILYINLEAFASWQDGRFICPKSWKWKRNDM